MNLCTPALVHDGVFYKDQWFFTSIDGKVMIVEDSLGTDKTCQEQAENMHLYNRDLVAKLIRLSDKESLGREPNWCRGLAVNDESIFTTIDGRYDTELAFGLLEIDHDGKVKSLEKLFWNEIADENLIRYVTGFDVTIIKS